LWAEKERERDMTGEASGASQAGWGEKEEKKEEEDGGLIAQ
jgi:hypothetical protein